MMVATPIPPFSVVVIVVAPKARVVETSAVVSVVVPSKRLFLLLDSSYAFPDELCCIIGVSVVFGRGEEFGNRARPFAQ